MRIRRSVQRDERRIRDPSRVAAAALCVALLASPASAQPASKQPRSPPDKAAALLKRGYVELAGDDAVQFLIGKSILTRKQDVPANWPTDDVEHDYYFLDAHTMYDCSIHGAICSTEAWKVEGKPLCLVGDTICGTPEFAASSHPRLFKAPQPDRTGTHGVYLEYGQIAHRIVSGHAPDLPLFDPAGTGQHIEFDPADLARLASRVPADGEPSNQPAEIARPQAVSLRIGNTFISEETAKDASGQTRFCPVQGLYYAPEGRIVVFNCDAWPDRWSFMVVRWKMQDGRFCRQDSQDSAFGCHVPPLYGILPTSGGKVLISEDEYPRRAIGYAGNIFNFHFEEKRDQH